MNCEEKDFKNRLQRIIDSLEWFGFDECPNCKSPLKFSVLDGDEGVICPKCSKSVIYGDLFPDSCETYQMLFLNSIRESMRSKIDATYDFRSSYIEAYTSLEVFLSKVVENQFKKKHLDDKTISFILDEMKPDVKLYFRFIENLDVGLKKEDKDQTNKLIEIQKIRNQIVHKAKCPSEEEILEALERIAKVFHILSAYSVFDKKTKIEKEDV